MTSTDEMLTGTYVVLADFAEAVQVGELSFGLAILGNLSEQQQGELLNMCIMLLDRAMANEIPNLPPQLSTLEGIDIPRVSHPTVRGLRSAAHGVVVSSWNNEAVEFVTDLARIRGRKYSVCAVALGAASLLLTWRLQADRSLQSISNCILMSGILSANLDDAHGSEASHSETEAKSAPASTPDAAATPEFSIPPNMMQQVNIKMRKALKLRAETAVLRTAHLPGGYRSQVTLIEGALEQELTRLEAEFNNGEPFPPNGGSFRTGRPLGS
ncbi:hypothetical protein [Arthrobacter sp.]|uniref:hypothetical protein n=1 Tax=Arthrobacter sp. TaxID=1667 RepID=UPI003A910C47